MPRDFDVVWLRELERRIEQGLPLDSREVLVALRDQLPPGFKPSDVDQRLLYGPGPSIEGLRLLGDRAQILPDVERTIRHIRDRLIEHPSLAKVTAVDIAQALRLPAKRVERVLQLMSSAGGSFMSAASGSPDGYSEIGLGRDDIIAEYLGFESLERLLARQPAAMQAPPEASVRRGPQAEPRQTRPLRAKLPLAHDSEPDHERVLSHQMKVFISWSGERSHKLAILLYNWLPSVIQAVEPYVSSENLQKGTRWPIDLARELEQTAFGILCIVPDNTGAPWLNFEAGALSKIVKDARVVPLLFDLEPSALVGHPLGQFQAAKFEKGEVLKTLKSMNELLAHRALDSERLKTVFEQWWPKLAQDVAAVPRDERSAALAADQRGSASDSHELAGSDRFRRERPEAALFEEVKHLQEEFKKLPADGVPMGSMPMIPGVHALVHPIIPRADPEVVGSFLRLDRQLDQYEAAASAVIQAEREVREKKDLVEAFEAIYKGTGTDARALHDWGQLDRALKGASYNLDNARVEARATYHTCRTTLDQLAQALVAIAKPDERTSLK